MLRNLQLVAGTLAALAATGGAAAQARSDYAFGLSTDAPASAAGMRLKILYGHPDGKSAKPPALAALSIDLPVGLRLDTGVTPSCQASDAAFRLRGRGACPAASRIGSGTLVAMTGLPGLDPVTTDLTVFNGGDELIELVSFKGTNVTAGLDRLSIRGSRLVAHPPAVPGGPPDGRTTVREIALRIGPRSTGSRSLITTPPDCPAGVWSSRLNFSFVSYPAPFSLADSTPCAQTAKPRMRLKVRPRKALPGKRTRFRVKVSSKAPSCRGGVRVRLGRSRAITNRRGRARIRTRLRRRGLRSLRAAKRGCRPARASIRIR